MQLLYLFLVLAVAAIDSKVIDLNDITDTDLAKGNELLRERGFTRLGMPDGQFGELISFSGSDLLGLDSWKRTGNCTCEIKGSNTSYDHHYGLGLLQQSFKIMNIAGTKMSASFRIRDNSFRFAYTIHNSTRCYATLDDLAIERLTKVDFYSSRAEYDGIDVEDFFQNVIIPFLNNKIDKAAVEKALQLFCARPLREISEHIPLIQKSIKEHFMPRI